MAKYKGALDFSDLGGLEIPCYVLEGGVKDAAISSIHRGKTWKHVLD